MPGGVEVFKKPPEREDLSPTGDAGPTATYRQLGGTTPPIENPVGCACGPHSVPAPLKIPARYGGGPSSFPTACARLQNALVQ
jgi:hypothetical protein